MDAQHYDSQDHASIAELRGKKELIKNWLAQQIWAKSKSVDAVLRKGWKKRISTKQSTLTLYFLRARMTLKTIQ